MEFIVLWSSLKADIETMKTPQGYFQYDGFHEE